MAKKPKRDKWTIRYGELPTQAHLDRAPILKTVDHNTLYRLILFSRHSKKNRPPNTEVSGVALLLLVPMICFLGIPGIILIVVFGPIFQAWEKPAQRLAIFFKTSEKLLRDLIRARLDPEEAGIALWARSVSASSTTLTRFVSYAGFGFFCVISIYLFPPTVGWDARGMGEWIPGAIMLGIFLFGTGLAAGRVYFAPYHMLPAIARRIKFLRWEVGYWGRMGKWVAGLIAGVVLSIVLPVAVGAIFLIGFLFASIFTVLLGELNPSMPPPFYFLLAPAGLGLASGYFMGSRAKARAPLHFQSMEDDLREVFDLLKRGDDD